MPSPQKHPISYTKSDSEQDEWPILSTNDHELLPSGEAHEVQSSDPARNGTEPSKAVRQFTGFASIKRKSDRFWEACNVYVNRPWNMHVLVIIGTLFAVGHHLFYLHLNGKEAINQPMMLRYGTVIAFFAKASLGTAVTIAFHQRAWRVVRFKTARVQTIDSIFTANTDFSSLLMWSSIRKAKIGTLLALYCWVTPLVVILTSETLSVVVGVFEEDHSCTSVRTLNFENEEKVYWRNPQKIDDPYLVSVSLWNSTLDYGESPSDSNAEGFDYYHSSSKQFDMLIAIKTTLMGEAIVRKESAAEICGEGWNCSYVVNFVAPGYKCQELASGRQWGTEPIMPSTTEVSMVIPKCHLTLGGKPKQNPLYPDNFGVFRTEPIMWIGYATVDDLSVPQPDTPGTEAWKKAYTPVIIGCEHYEVNYTAQFNYTGGAQFVDIKRREYLRKVVDTTYIPEKDTDKRLKDRTQAVPDSNYIFPADVK
ncbi:hypothetical protein FOXG_04889 [Fusarium oxysporum f. sp. lycopersici 4287]|uniref:Uncharacterized protein n=1 Tax=Fusarium oxysporum f. sp. lycopersici (strain 4287 / CBS 123668 / FGSC 9935 / NRRL 34936) TaxID=426428 RepID=A0A0J9WKA7_FUSO4|nr:hypothetical protein FOXG_04889 [Fusarium oxysporum f. sp. lycopersici 4287]KNB01702.1 hypothetical protein FOXG_04889 [Fusarium oxysporum f. sp. lycopersici 4287]